MAKMFYTAEEAAKRLGKSTNDLKKLVREGSLREFRDAGKFNYKVDDVEELVAAMGIGSKSEEDPSASSEIILEPVEDSSVEPAPTGGSDVLSLEEVDSADDTSMGTAVAEKKKKEGSVVPSVGVNVFDDEELDDAVDPLAQTAVTDVAGLGLDGSGSGSGILDLTRESDDTSLGAELLDEIYTDEPAAGKEGAAADEASDDTKAGLDMLPEAGEGEEEAFAEEGEEPVTAGVAEGAVVEVLEFAPDAWSAGLTALMAVAILAMWIAGLAGAALVRGVSPGIVQAVYDNMIMYAAGTLVVGVIAGAAAFFLAKRSS